MNDVGFWETFNNTFSWQGCTDGDALNYNANAIFADNSQCEYAEE